MLLLSFGGFNELWYSIISKPIHGSMLQGGVFFILFHCFSHFTHLSNLICNKRYPPPPLFFRWNFPVTLAFLIIYIHQFICVESHDLLQENSFAHIWQLISKPSKSCPRTYFKPQFWSRNDSSLGYCITGFVDGLEAFHSLCRKNFCKTQRVRFVSSVASKHHWKIIEFPLFP